MKLTDKQFMNLLEDLVKEVTSKKEVLLETPGKKKTIREKLRERKSGKT
jgi:hypothetical protein|tara:strand:- start:412 stop:558 length:147 start_codon:yes stop_codon:yes gene_type:complete